MGVERNPGPPDLPSAGRSPSAPIIERAPLPLVEVQGSRHVVSWVNFAFCALLGKARGELLGKCFAEIVPGGEECMPLLDKIYRTGEPITHAQDPDEDPASWLYAMWPALDPDERPVGVIIQVARVARTQQDLAVNEALLIAGLHQHELVEAAEKLNARLRGEIAERERAEQALRGSESRLVEEVTSLGHLHELSVRLLRSRDLNGGLEEMLDAAIELLAADMGTVQLLNPRKQVLELVVQRGFKQDFLDFYREVSAGQDCACGRALREGQRTLVEDVETEPAHAPFRQVAAAAGYRGVHSTPLLRRDGSVLGMLSTHFRSPHRPSAQELRRLDLYLRQAADFIEWIQSQAALHRSEERFRSLVSVVTDVPWIMDAQGAFVEPQPDWEAYTGQSQESYRGAGWVNVLHPDDLASVAALLSAARASGTPCRFDGRLWNAARKQWRHFTARATPLLNPDGTVREWVGACTDVNDQKEAMAKLATADHNKDDFLAMLAHELRNPLAPVMNAARILRMLKSDNSIVNRAQEIIERQADHLTKLVDDLLDVSRIQKGKVRLRKERLELSAAISRSVDGCEHLIKAQDHIITLSLQRLPPLYIDADPTRIDQILVNLIGNAAKYTPPRGTIHIAAAREEGLAVVRVRDNGLGIAPDDLQRVFEVFTQVDRSLERSQGGLGLGLKLVKELVEMHGGSVEARSEGLNRGSEFILRLPALDTVDSKPIPAPKLVAANAKPRRILVVDDSPDSRETMQMFLAMLGHSVETAEDGQEAVDQALRSLPEVAFVDIGLPILSGYEVAKQIRQGPGGQGIVLVALSGYVLAEDKRKALAAGFDVHLSKPADLDAVTKLLNDLENFNRRQP